MATLARYRALALSRPPRVLLAIQQVLRLIPAAKYIAIALLLLNAGAWPLLWHFRLFAPLFEGYFGLSLVKLRHVFSGTERRREALEAWYEGHMQIGEHPFRKVWTRSLRVRLDQGDFNMHMSNSSYAQVLDAARLRLALSAFPNIFRCGGWVPLSATYYHFIREIPIFSKYEVRASIGSFDDKWLWVVSRFVKPPSKKSKSKSKSKSAPQSATATATEGEPPHSTLIPTLKTPATPLASGSTTPLLGPGTGFAGSASGDGDGEAVAHAQALLAREVAKAKTEEGELDGAMLYTITVEQFCFKLGRITVPPAVVLAANGFFAPPASSTTPPSIPSPSPSSSTSTKPPLPPYYPALRPLLHSMPALAAFYAGGWRLLPPGERWWEEAFKACEEERRGRLVPFVGVAAAEVWDGEKGQGKSGVSGGLEAVRRLRN
ncbi:hypothetical protein B0H11DRAFT_2037461 [Mycena galericulata]|nr:hypothetical protein B0H11DRAFT_2037461 [Mycena galericulata]